MTSVSRPKKRLATPCGHLPIQIRALFVAGSIRASGWLADAFAADTACEVILTETAGMVEGLARLRDENFDVVLVSHEDGLDALDFLDAMRGGGGDKQAIVVLGENSEQAMNAFCYEAGADGYVCLQTATTRALLWTVTRAIERVRLDAENQQLKQTRRRQLQNERKEVARLLSERRALVDYGSSGVRAQFPLLLTSLYHELLQSYIVMGSGRLADDVHQFTDLLTTHGISPQDAMELHLQVLDNLLHGLGNRSTRHAMTRADMLALQVMLNLATR
ncbi:MAG: hypothetical protein H6822_03425 [Planctomycetaceae bacterium]|nr:hypothetical protein [Planctomycetales bacterium]MCB9921205.1 hypothetical protein [Planctomycetaceae bacterium]